MEKELLYKIEFVGTDVQLEKLSKITKEQERIRGSIKETKKDSKLSADERAKQLTRQQEQLRELNKEQRETRTQIDRMAKGQQAMNQQTEIAKMSVGEMRREIRLLRETPIADKSEAEVKALNTRVGQLNDAMMKLRQEQEGHGMDAFQSYAGAIQGATAASQLFTAGLSAMGAETESVQKLQNAMVQLIGVSQALKTLEELHHKRVLQATVRNIQYTFAMTKNAIATGAAAKAEAARTVALTSGNVATRAAATVTWLWNAALAANPVVLIVAGVAALGAGIFALTKIMRRNKAETEEMNTAYEKQEGVLSQIESRHQKEAELARARGITAGEDLEMQKLQNRERLRELQLLLILAETRTAKEQERAGWFRKNKKNIQEAQEEEEKLRQIIEALGHEYDVLTIKSTNNARAEADNARQKVEEQRKAHLAALDAEINHHREMERIRIEFNERWNKELLRLDAQVEAARVKRLEDERKYQEAKNATIIPFVEEMEAIEELAILRAMDNFRFADEQYKLSYQGRLDALKKMLDEGLIGEQRYDQMVKDITVERNEVIKQSYGQLFNTLRKGFNENAKALRAISLFEQGVALAMTIAEISKGYAKNAASVQFPFNIAALAGFAAQTAGIVSTIKSLKTPAPPNINPIKFADGGIIGGKPHSMGGTKFVGSDGSTFEAEKGEAMVIINKHDTPMLSALSEINSRHGRKFAQGGVVGNTAGMGRSNAMIRQIIEQIAEIPVVVAEGDISTTQERVRKIKVTGDV